ncbi:MAG: MBOAT family protein [Clostridia bacterium]|nr:MBOAT family protein [Clostridia bacterium]
MVFSSLTFLCLFLPIVVGLHTFIKNGPVRNAILLVASLLFYAWGEPVWIVAMLFATAVNYVCARIIDQTKSPGRRKLALVVGVIISLSALLYFKYAAFLVNNLCVLLGMTFRMAQPKLPIGISFYTFQIITYTVDVYRGDAPLQKNPLWLLLYVSLFPQLIAGPIVRYSDVADSMEERKVTPTAIGEGFFRFSLGLGKKVLLANICGEVLESLPAAADLSFFSGWLAAILFQLQLYFDFSGYSEMAIGLGRMVGFKFPENFDAPFISQSISEFWQRWHISLGTFFREYVYIPLGGNRVSRGRWVLNMAVVWGLTGIWHGANWNYLLWGLYFGFLIVLERTLLKDMLKRTPSFLKHFGTVLLAVVGLVIFRNESFADIGCQLRAMLAPWRVALSDPYAVYAVKSNPLLLFACVICSFPLRKMAAAWFARRKAEGKRNAFRPYGRALLSAVILGLSLLFLVGQSFNPFLYFRF